MKHVLSGSNIKRWQGPLEDILVDSALSAIITGQIFPAAIQSEAPSGEPNNTTDQATNDNFWQAISVFMFQGECTVNLNNLFSKPSTPILTWTNPRQSFLGNYDYASHFTYDNSSVSVRFHFLDLHLPSSASVWSVLFGFSTM